MFSYDPELKSMMLTMKPEKEEEEEEEEEEDQNESENKDLKGRYGIWDFDHISKLYSKSQTTVS